MISSAIWNKQARVNFSKTHKIARALRARASLHVRVYEKLISAYLFQIAQEKSCDYLLIIYMKKNSR